MWIKIGVWVVVSLICGVLYRLGGTKSTLWRDIGCSLVFLAYCLYLGLFTSFLASLVAYIIAFGMMWGAAASYWGLDEKKWGYWAHGLGLSLAALPIAFVTHHWVGFGIRTLILTGLITIWSEYTKWDVLEESGRGAFIVATLPLLCLPI